jgi:hypothetical protein
MRSCKFSTAIWEPIYGLMRSCKSFTAVWVPNVVKVTDITAHWSQAFLKRGDLASGAGTSIAWLILHTAVWAPNVVKVNDISANSSQAFLKRGDLALASGRCRKPEHSCSVELEALLASGTVISFVSLNAFCILSDDVVCHSLLVNILELVVRIKIEMKFIGINAVLHFQRDRCCVSFNFTRI